MFVVCIRGVVVKVVDHEGVAVCREVNVELEEEGDEGAGCWSVCGECEEDVSVVLCEVEEDIGRQGGTESLQSCWQEEQMVVCKVAVHEERGIRLWCIIVDFITSSCISV